MSTLVRFDFSRPATLGHFSEAPFDPETEKGRAFAEIGSGESGVRIEAGSLGDWANGVRFSVLAAAGTEAQSQYDYGGAGHVKVRPGAGMSAGELVRTLNAPVNDPRRQQSLRLHRETTDHMLTGRAPWTFRYASLTEDGTDPADLGTALLAGGEEPQTSRDNQTIFESDAAGGLFVFDSPDPLVLMQFVAHLESSQAWTLTLRPSFDRSVAFPVASGTGQILRVDTPVVILPGWGLGFGAGAKGGALCTVKRA